MLARLATLCIAVSHVLAAAAVGSLVADELGRSYATLQLVEDLSLGAYEARLTSLGAPASMALGGAWATAIVAGVVLLLGLGAPVRPSAGALIGGAAAAGVLNGPFSLGLARVLDGQTPSGLELLAALVLGAVVSLPAGALLGALAAPAVVWLKRARDEDRAVDLERSCLAAAAASALALWLPSGVVPGTSHAVLVAALVGLAIVAWATRRSRLRALRALGPEVAPLTASHALPSLSAGQPSFFASVPPSYRQAARPLAALDARDAAYVRGDAD